MLEPDSRTLLFDCLRPPSGFHLDEAIGTTYTLDLYALLGVPLAFAFEDAVLEDGSPDPLATLEALRRNAARIHIFCQAGAIQVPRGQQRLFAFLEECVHPVMPATQSGVFHPKVWMLRFVGPENRFVYRLVCLSRNLTFDRSWDTVLVLDGEPHQRPVRKPNPKPLVTFLQALPGLTTHPLRDATLAAIARMTEDLPRVRFELPLGVESLRFWPMGITGHAAPRFTPGHRPLLIISPFLSSEWLEQRLAGGRQAYLVSREDQLSALPDGMSAHFAERYVLLPQATPEEDLEAQGDDNDLLDGLHAKLFVMDDGWNAHIWTGSANATNAAFHQNVELLVELVGKKSRLGISALLGESDDALGFRDLLEPWSPPKVRNEDTDPVAERLQEQLRAAQRALAGADLQVSVYPSSDSGNAYNWVVEGTWPPLPGGVSGWLWPVGLERERARPISGEPVGLEELTLEAVSAFVAFELSASEAGQSQSTRFVLRLPMYGTPADRNSRLLRNMLQDPSAFMRLLMLLLADDISGLGDPGANTTNSSAASWFAGDADAPLLESLLKALDRAPERLDQIERLLADLADGGELSTLLPQGFLEVWEPIWANRAKAVDRG